MAASATAKTVTLIRYIPEGLPMPEHFAVVESPAPTEADLDEGSLLLKVLCMSADPYLRSGCKNAEKAGGLTVPRAMAGFVSGKVLASKRAGWEAGDLFGASLPFTTVQVLTAAAAAKTVMWKLSDYCTEDTISLGVGVLGMPGSTAYGGLIDVLRPLKRRETPEGAPEVIWVSGAAGAVGGLVGQLAKQVFGCTVVGSAGGAEKCSLVTTKFGFDSCVDYKGASTAEELAARVKAVAPEGVDMYFDNVGGLHFEAAMSLLRTRGRVAICGGISHYNEGDRRPDKFFPMDLIYSFQRVEGFMCMPWLTGQQGAFLKDMARWLGEGKLAVEETRFEGVRSWPLAFHALFTGGNTGKVVVDVAVD